MRVSKRTFNSIVTFVVDVSIMATFMLFCVIILASVAYAEEFTTKKPIVGCYEYVSIVELRDAIANKEQEHFIDLMMSNACIQIPAGKTLYLLDSRRGNSRVRYVYTRNNGQQDSVILYTMDELVGRL